MAASVLPIVGRLAFCVQKICLKPVTYLSAKRYSSYYSSRPEGLPEDYTGVEVSRDKEEWKYVERLLPNAVVPEPPKKDHYPSGWQPPTEKSLTYSFYIRRTKNHMLPVYLDVTHRGLRRITRLRNVEGNIWDLAKELLAHLQTNHETIVAHRVHEVCCTVYLKGDHVRNIENWLYSKGF